MTISHAVNNISKYRKRYGMIKAVRATLHYGYVASRKLWLKKSRGNIIEVNGYKLAIIPDDRFGTSSELLIFKTHEPLSTELISRTLKSGMICLDIGANIGYYVLLEKKLVGKEGKIIAIEPSPINFQYLKNNVGFQDSSNVELFNFAAGDQNGNINFLIYENAANSCMVIPDGEESKWPGKVIKVPVRRIDSLLDEIGINKIDFVRMDVEGYEFNIFEGMQNTIRNSRPIIQIEVHKSIMGMDKTRNFLQGLKDNGYEVKAYIPREIDTPMIGTAKDIKNYSMNELMQMLTAGSLPSFFMLTLQNLTEDN